MMLIHMQTDVDLLIKQLLLSHATEKEQQFLMNCKSRLGYISTLCTTLYISFHTFFDTSFYTFLYIDLFMMIFLHQSLYKSLPIRSLPVLDLSFY